MKTRQRHVPLRRCVACGTQRPQRELVRIVRTALGQVAVDPGRKARGRGAYLCESPNCWERSLKGNRLDHALRGRIAPEDRRLLQEVAEEMAQRV